MSDAQYMVVFRGDLVEGADLEQVKESLKQFFKLTHDKVEQLFSLPAVVLKKELNHELAEAFIHQLEKIGVLAEIMEMAEAKVIALGSHGGGESDIAATESGGDGSRVAAVESEEDMSEQQRLQVEFNGNGGEYFKIWIVNVFLTILTVGIYSAWAKVRNHRYFYSNTRIGSGSFEYTADPMAILKGRIVAVIFLLVFNYSATALPPLYGVLSLVFIIAVPWLINRSMAFRNRNTVYRNVRFGFNGNYMEALKAFVLWPIAGVLSFGLLMPYAIYKQKSYIVQSSRYGTSAFEPSFEWRHIFGVAIRAFLLVILAGVLLVVPFVGPLLGIAIYLFAFAYFTANISNVVYNSSNLTDHGFDSTLEAKSLAMLYFTNWLMIAFTLGLAMPWAKVRLAKYRAEHLALLVNGSLDNFVVAEEEQVNSLGEEIGEAFDMDIGL